MLQPKLPSVRADPLPRSSDVLPLFKFNSALATQSIDEPLQQQKVPSNSRPKISRVLLRRHWHDRKLRPSPSIRGMGSILPFLDHESEESLLSVTGQPSCFTHPYENTLEEHNEEMSENIAMEDELISFKHIPDDGRSIDGREDFEEDGFGLSDDTMMFWNGDNHLI